jgi:hypothetical protein
MYEHSIKQLNTYIDEWSRQKRNGYHQVSVDRVKSGLSWTSLAEHDGMSQATFFLFFFIIGTK